MKALSPAPAYVLDPRWRLVAWNEALTDLIPPLRDRQSGASFLEIFLTDAAVRDVLPDWEAQASRIVTHFRLHVAQFPGPQAEHLVDALSANSSIFREVWRAQDVDRFQTMARSFLVAGSTVQFDQHRLEFADRPGWTLTVFVAVER